MKHSHYFKDVSTLEFIDVYRILNLYRVTDNAIGHAIKKLLCAGDRGAKSLDTDVQEAIDTLHRWQEMQIENMKAVEPDPEADVKKTVSDAWEMMSAYAFATGQGAIKGGPYSFTKVKPWEQPDNMDYCDREEYEFDRHEQWKAPDFGPCEHQRWHFYQSTHTKVCQNPACKHTEPWNGG